MTGLLLFAGSCWAWLSTQFGSSDVQMWVLAGLSFLYFSTLDRSLNRHIRNATTDPEAEYRASFLQLIAAPVRADRDAWIGIEGDLRTLVFRSTAALRMHSSDCVDRLFQANRDRILAHVGSRWSPLRVFFGFPRYEQNAVERVKALESGDPRKLELLLNALTFPVVTRLAAQDSNWRAKTRRAHPRNAVSSLRTRVTFPKGAADAEVVDISENGLCLRIEGQGSCGEIDARAGVSGRAELLGKTLDVTVRWSRERTFGVQLVTPGHGPGA